MIRYIKASRLISHIFVAFVLLIVTGSLINNKTRIVKSTKRWWLNKATRIMGVRIIIDGDIPASKEHQGFLFVSNHVSWLDIPVIGGLTRINFLSKAEVQQWPLIGKLAEGTGTLFIRRGTGDADTIAGKMADYIEEGRSVLFFPEGTTSDGSSVKRFHSKLFRVTQQTATQLCPIAIHYHIEGVTGNPVAFIDDDEFTQHLWKLLGFREITATVKFLPPITLGAGAIQSGALESIALEPAVRLLRQDIAEAVTELNTRTNTSIQSPDASTPVAPRAEATSF